MILLSGHAKSNKLVQTIVFFKKKMFGNEKKYGINDK